MQRQFFSGNSVDQAVMIAARHFGIEPERLSYKVRDKKTGFLNARRRVVIEVDPQTPLLSDEEMAAKAKPASRPNEERRPERVERPRAERAPAEGDEAEEMDGEAPVREPRPSFVRQQAPAPVEDEEEDGQTAFGLGVGQTPAESPAGRNPNDRGAERPPRPDGGRGGRKGGRGQDGPRGSRGAGQGRNEGSRPEARGEARVGEPRVADARGPERGGPERGGPDRGARGGQDRDRGGRNRRGGQSQDRRGRPANDRGPARKGARAEERPRRETVKAVEHTWKDGEWRELLSEEGDNVSREVLAFEKAIELILDVMDLDIEFSVSDGEIYLVEFSGEDRNRLVAEEGRALKAIEHILPRIVRGMVGEALPCRVDCEDFQASRELELIELAKKTAEEVGRSMKPRLLPPMSPADRRIVHVTLMEDPGVDTMSEGDGFIKRIKIFPVRH